MTEPTYTLDQLMQMIRFTRHSKANGRQAYKTRDSILTAFGRACKLFEDTHGNDSLRDEYVRRRNSNSLTKEFLDRIFPYFPSVTSFEGKPLKVIDYSLATTEADPTVPPIDLSYTARVVEASERRELEKVNGQSPFDRIRHVDHRGEWWDARELQVELGYEKWQNFENAIEKAKLSIKASDGLQVEHFTDVSKVTTGGNGAKLEVDTYRLSRHACHLIAINGDPSKPQIAAAQLYFSVQTRRAELMDAGLSPIERTAHIDALVSGQQQLTAAVGEIGENLGSVEVKVLTVLEIMQQQNATWMQQQMEQIESLRLEVTKSQTPAVADLKRLHGKLYQDVLEQAYRYQDGIHCPCCNKATTTWEIDHWRSKADPARTNGWKVCRSCNQALGAAGDSTKRDKYKNRFDAFQMRCDDYEQYLNGDEIKQLGLL